MRVSDEVIAKEVLRLQERDGLCTPAAFVEAASDEASPLHALFAWDDESEAQQWREHRARQIIGRVRITLNGNRTPAHVHVTISTDKGKRHGYIPVEVAMGDDELRAQVFAEARSGLEGWRDRLAAFDQAAAAIELISGAIESLTG